MDPRMKETVKRGAWKAMPGLVAGILLGGLLVSASSIEVATRFRWALPASMICFCLLGVTALGCLLFARFGFRRGYFSKSRTQVRTIGMLFATIFFTSLMAFMFHNFVIQPLKLRHLIRRLESARTVQEERAAFELAAQWGRIWELSRLTDREWWPAHMQHLEGDCLLQVEWLESSAWTGKPYRAYRIVLDERNLRVSH